MAHLNRSTAGRGFTLVELLIVLIILGILAAIVVPSFGASSEDAKVSALRSNLATLRRAIQVYQAQHAGRVPGEYMHTDGTTPVSNRGQSGNSFINQLTRYSDAGGMVSDTRTASARFGPYVKSADLPHNPFSVGSDSNEVDMDLAQTDIMAAPIADGGSGWRFYVRIGRLVANDGTTLSDGVTQTVNF